MVSLKIEVRKKDVTWVVLLVAVLVVGVVYAYGTSNPSVMGHSAEEIEVTNAFCNKITGHNCGVDNVGSSTSCRVCIQCDNGEQSPTGWMCTGYNSGTSGWVKQPFNGWGHNCDWVRVKIECN